MIRMDKFFVPVILQNDITDACNGATTIHVYLLTDQNHKRKLMRPSVT